MTEGGFNVVFRGQLTGDQPAPTVKRNLAALFKLPEHRIDVLFRGGPVVIKRGVDEGTGRKLEAAFRKAGAVCELEPVASPDDGGDAPARQRAATGQAAAPGPSAAGAAGRSPSSALAAGDPNRTIVDLAIPDDLGGLAIDDSDTPLEPPSDQEPAAIDTSGLSIADADAPLSDRPRPSAPDIDTSGLGLEPEEPGSGPQSGG